jgi:hypothetical protein
MFSFRFIFEAAYKGNIGIIELFQFYEKAEKENPELFKEVKALIKQNKEKEVWKKIQDYLNVKLVDK